MKVRRRGRRRRDPITATAATTEEADRARRECICLEEEEADRARRECICLEEEEEVVPLHRVDLQGLGGGMDGDGDGDGEGRGRDGDEGGDDNDCGEVRRERNGEDCAGIGNRQGGVGAGEDGVDGRKEEATGGQGGSRGGQEGAGREKEGARGGQVEVRGRNGGEGGRQVRDKVENGRNGSRNGSSDIKVHAPFLPLPHANRIKTDAV